ncbi:MAG TPA: hypothetical protein VJB57_11505 [Dehalococcoidia bacterium]|nr:hypothetical protein [Dehalococcoidia bacterium]
MNTRKQVLIMAALLAVMLVVVGIYAAWYPSRATDAAEHFDEQTAERGSILFARNCRLCHGDIGEGGGLGARLPAAPALNRSDLQGFVDSKATLASNLTPSANQVAVSSGTAFKAGAIILLDEERLEVTRVNGNNLSVLRGVGHTEAASHSSGANVSLLDSAGLTDKIKLITNTITCGRVGSAMPAWAQSQNGPLSDEQIRQLMTLITHARWDLVKEEIDIEDKVNTKILAPISDDTISIRLSDVSVFTEKEAIRIGEERLRVTGVPKLPKDKAGNLPKDRSGIIEVQRGVLGTTPLEHGPEETIYRFPEVSEPSINQTSCGQTAKPAAPAEPPGLIEPFEGQTVEVIAQNVTFNVKEITARIGGRIRVRLDNKDAATEHNIAFYKSSSDLTAVSPGSVGTIFKGLAVDDTAFDVPSAGSYFFRCDVHPTTMTGTFTVR